MTTVMTIMAEGRRQKQEISLRDDLDAVVQYGGTTVELSADGTVIVNINGNAAIYVGPHSEALVRLNTVANDEIRVTHVWLNVPKLGENASRTVVPCLARRAIILP